MSGTTDSANDSDSPNYSEEMAYLARSDHRVRILRTLQRQRLDIRDLGHELGTPRTTLRDNLETMAEFGWITEDTDRKYETTSVGSVVAEAFEAYCDRVETSKRLRPVLKHVPREMLDPDLGNLSEFELVEATPAHPQAPDNRLQNLADTASFIKGFIPAVVPMTMKRAEERMATGDLEIEYIASPTAVETFMEMYDPTDFESVTNGRTEVALVDEELPFGAMFSEDGRVFVMAFDDRNRLEAVMETTSGPCREWIERLYDDFHEDALVLDEEFVDALSDDD